LYLVVKNLANVPITITHIGAPSAGFVTVTLPNLGAGLTLEPRQAHVFPIKVAAGDQVQPGKYEIVLETDLQWTRLGHSYNGSLVTTYKCELAVFGESEISRIVGAPVFFLVPGFLILTVFVGLWTYVLPRSTLNLKPTTPEFWPIAVTLALLIIIAYPFVTEKLGKRRDYLEGHGFRDLVYLWLGSVVLGMLFWFAVVLAIGLFRLGKLLWAKVQQVYQAWLTMHLVPTVKDPPILVLKKLARNRMPFAEKRVQVTLDEGAAQPAFVIVPRYAGQTHAWIAPAMSVQWNASPEAKTLRDQFTALLDQPQKVSELVEVLRQGQKQELCTIQWIAEGKLVGPTPVPVSQLGARLDNPERMVQDES
jgi:hypothetical protein